MYQDIKLIRSEKIKCSRKQQQCWQCQRDIPKGSELIKDTLLIIGEIGSAYSCINCKEDKK